MIINRLLRISHVCMCILYLSGWAGSLVYPSFCVTDEFGVEQQHLAAPEHALGLNVLTYA
jgi:hypothetical protein